MTTDSLITRRNPDDALRSGPPVIDRSARPLVPSLPDAVRRARSAGRPWAIRIACVWDTIERYDQVRRRHDRLPAHHLVCGLARDVGALADDDVLGARAAWSTIASRLDAACADPLGEEPAEAIAHLVDLVTGLADDAR